MHSVFTAAAPTVAKPLEQPQDRLAGPSASDPRGPSDHALGPMGPHAAGSEVLICSQVKSDKSGVHTWD